MSTILYPTRGGDSTYLNQDWVFELTREEGASLLLLYVSNVRFLDLLAGPARLDLMEAELDEFGVEVYVIGGARSLSTTRNRMLTTKALLFQPG